MAPRRAPTPVARGATPATTTSSFTTPDATDSDENDSQAQAQAPAVIVSPVRRRQRTAAPGIRSQSDVLVWDLTDEEIIGHFCTKLARINNLTRKHLNSGRTEYLAF
jgi:hypothetical protein